MEQRYTPKAQNKNAVYLSAALFLVGCGLLAAGMAGAPAAAVYQLGFALLSAIAMLVWLRYCMSSYTYTVTDAYDVPMLIVTETRGRRISTACRVELGHVERIISVPDGQSAEGRAALAEYRSAPERYSYLSTLFPRSSVILYAHEGGRRFALRMEPCDAFFASLSERVFRAGGGKGEEE